MLVDGDSRLRGDFELVFKGAGLARIAKQITAESAGHGVDGLPFVGLRASGTSKDAEEDQKQE